MKELWAYWKKGWLVIFNLTWFGILISLFSLPVTLAEYFLGANGMAVWDNKGFHGRPCLIALLALIITPFACYLAAAMTGYFRKIQGRDS